MRMPSIRRSATFAVPLTLFCLVLPRGAAAQGCEHEAARTASAATSGVDRIVVIAHAGSLDVTGRAGIAQASVRGRACASDADRLAELTVTTRRDGTTLIIEANDPDDQDWGRNRYAYLDLVVEIPRGMRVRVEDGSGNLTVEGTGALDVEDGSGNMELRDIAGALTIDDGSGNIEVERAGGSIDIDDGSGNIDVTGAGSVEIEDGSGNIRLSSVRGSVRLDDGSGEIRVSDVTGSVTVDDDGSGSIRVEGVGGDFTVDDDGSGDVSYADVRGRVSVPDDD